MFRITRRQRRRWSLPMIAVILLHWCLGVGPALADVLCLEPDGKTVLELQGQPCNDEPAEKAAGPHCIDLAIDDGHADHEPLPAKPPASPDAPPLLPSLGFRTHFTPLVVRGREPPPLLPVHPVALRATTVLLI